MSSTSTTTSYPWTTTQYNGQGRKRRAPLKGVMVGQPRTNTPFTEPIYIQGSSAEILFKTDASVVYKGFKLRIEKGNPIVNQCDDLQNGSGVVTSPNWPNVHENDESCTYTLVAEPGHWIKVKVTSFDVEREQSCSFDSLTINGRSYCNGSEPQGESIMIRSDRTSITWTSDISVVNGGFRFEWESVEVTATSTPAGFWENMEAFKDDLVVQMSFSGHDRPWRARALERFFDRTADARNYFHTGDSDCDWSYSPPTMAEVQVSSFNGNVDRCQNLQTFGDMGKAWVESFVCMDGHPEPRRNYNRWVYLFSRISEIGSNMDC